MGCDVFDTMTDFHQSSIAKQVGTPVQIAAQRIVNIISVNCVQCLVWKTGEQTVFMIKLCDTVAF